VLVLAGVSLPVLAHDCPECADTASVSFWSSDWNLSWYAGLSYQFSEFEDWSISRIDSGSFTSRNEDDRDGGYRLAVGMGFLEYFGVEAAYSDFGEATFSGQSDGSGSVFAPGPQRDSVELDGYALHLIARVPIGNEFWVAGKAGWWQWRARESLAVNLQSGPFAGSQSDDGIRFSWGAGLDYDGFKPVRISVEYGAATFEAPNTVDAFGASEIRSLGVSLKYLF
jgi:hypothetical protein